MRGKPISIGILSPEWYQFYEMRVEQVVDSDTVVAKLQVMPKSPLDSLDVKSLSYWIHGMPTKGMVDDSPAIPKGWVLSDDGTKTYSTVSRGSRTIFKVEAHPLIEAQRYAGLFCVGGEVRHWRDKQGNILLDGSLVANRRGKITIRALDGKEKEIALDSLPDDSSKVFRDVIQWQSIEKKKLLEK